MLLLLLLSALPAFGQQELLSLDEAVRDFSRYLADRIQKDALTAVLNVEAPFEEISNYITDTLVEGLLNTAGARMVDRQNLETVKREQNIQSDSSIDDATAAFIGHIAGWKTVVTGTLRR
jgi:curli biogenesis system outer membrane secretion channel CsgG